VVAVAVWVGVVLVAVGWVIALVQLGRIAYRALAGP
jgi:hypothetical protein